MENYRKGKNVEEPLEREKIPIDNLPINFLWMHVRGGSKIRNLLSHALNEFPTARSVVWTGFGQSVGKAITCAEIMKREMELKLYQITRICYRQIEEYWDPLLSELDQLVVKRKLPMVHILLSLDELDSNALGYQAPGVTIAYQPGNEQKNKFSKFHNKPKNKEKQNGSRNKSRKTKVADKTSS